MSYVYKKLSLKKKHHHYFGWLFQKTQVNEPLSFNQNYDSSGPLVGLTVIFDR